MKHDHKHQLVAKRQHLKQRRRLAQKDGKPDPLDAKRAALRARRTEVFQKLGMPIPAVFLPPEDGGPPLKPSHPKARGLQLGDKFAVVAKPVAKAIDYLFGTNLSNCRRCEERRQDWNRIGVRESDTTPPVA